MDKAGKARALAIKVLRKTPPALLFRNPIEYVLADHLRQRTLCRILDEIAAEPEWDAEKIDAALHFLKTDFGHHMIDEEEDLFPLLRRRVRPEDRLNDVMGQLSQEHADAKRDADAIIAGLSAALGALEEPPDSAALRDRLRQFAANERRRLVAENAIVLPLARARLGADDLRTLGKRMAARRGLNYPEAADAIRPV